MYVPRANTQMPNHPISDGYSPRITMLAKTSAAGVVAEMGTTSETSSSAFAFALANCMQMLRIPVTSIGNHQPVAMSGPPVPNGMMRSDPAANMQVSAVKAAGTEDQ